MVTNIDTTDLRAMREGGDSPVVLDVREPWETALCTIADSMVIPMDRLASGLASGLETLPNDRPIVVVCHHGMRSAQVAHWLSVKGFDPVYNLAGGIDAWAREVDPSMRRY